ncbi:MAG: hypothetical protein RSC93_00095 [Erysipelotrichaceae bacterium]
MLIVSNDLSTAYLYTEKSRGYCLFNGTEMGFLCRWGLLPEFNLVENLPTYEFDDEEKYHLATDEDRHAVIKRILEIKDFFEKVLPSYKEIYDIHLTHGIKLPELVEAMNNLTFDKVGQVNHIYNLIIQRYDAREDFDE